MNLKLISDHDEILRVAYKWLHMQGFAPRSSSIWAERIKSCHVEEWCHLILPHTITSETFSHLFTQGIAVTFSSLEFFPHSQRLYASSAFEATPVKLVLLVSIIKFQYVKVKKIRAAVINGIHTVCTGFCGCSFSPAVVTGHSYV